MKLFLYALKNQINIGTLLMVIVVLTFICYKKQKRKVATILVTSALLIFLLSSTAYLPQYLATQLESHYRPFDPIHFKHSKEKIYIHVLGSGYSLDSSLPATTRLGLVAQARLAEGIRLFRQIDRAILVTSAGSLRGMETQASVARKAAILLGVDSNRIVTLDTPNTTKEEAAAMAALSGTNARLIIVTDAMHMPRAIKFFTQQGFSPIAAPANYGIHKEVVMSYSFKWWPSLRNMDLMDKVLHEYLGNLKGSL